MKHLIVIVVLAALGSAAHSFETVEWSDLVDPSAQEFDDPYRDLSLSEIEALRTIALARQSLASGDLSEGQQTELEEKIQQANQQLLENDIDADWLIDQRWVVADLREKAATAGNPAVDGQVITLGGFAIPAPPDADGTPVAYLVPERGMCSHMPPPNANQMIRVRLTDAWQPSIAHEPVRLTGKISVAPTKEVFRIVDGPVKMSATFQMEVEQAETVADIKAQLDTPITNDWANEIAQKLRASGALPSTLQSVKQ